MDIMQRVFQNFLCTEQVAAPAPASGLFLPGTNPLFDRLEQTYGPRKREVCIFPAGEHVAAYAFLNPVTRAYCRVSVATGRPRVLYTFVLQEYAFMAGPLPHNNSAFPRLGDWSYAYGSHDYLACTVVLKNVAIELVEPPDQEEPMRIHCESLVRTLQDAVVPDYRRHVPDLTLSAEPEFNCWKLTLHCPAGFDSLTLDYFFVGAPYKVQKLGTGKYTVTIQQGIDYTPVPIAFYATDNASLLGRVVLFSPETGIVTPV